MPCVRLILLAIPLPFPRKSQWPECRFYLMLVELYQGLAQLRERVCALVKLNPAVSLFWEQEEHVSAIFTLILPAYTNFQLIHKKKHLIQQNII